MNVVTLIAKIAQFNPPRIASRTKLVFFLCLNVPSMQGAKNEHDRWDIMLPELQTYKWLYVYFCKIYVLSSSAVIDRITITRVIDNVPLWCDVFKYTKYNYSESDKLLNE